MMNDRPQSEELFSMYLLGELPDEDLPRLEELLFADDAYYDQLLSVEDELRYDYAQGLLGPERRERVEKRLAASPGDRQALAFARAFASSLSALSTLSAPSASSPLSAPFAASAPSTLSARSAPSPPSALSAPESEAAQASPQLAEVPPVPLGLPPQNTLNARHLLTQTTRVIARLKPGSLRLPHIRVTPQPLPAPIAEVVLPPEPLQTPPLTHEEGADFWDRVARIIFAAVGLFLLVCVVYVIAQTIRYQNQVRELRRELGMQKGSWSQTEEEKSRAQELQQELEVERSRRLMLEEEATKRNKQTGQKPDPPAAASFVVSPGLNRDSGPLRKPRIQLGDADRVRLQLNLKAPGDFQSYQALLKSAEGRLIWGQAGLRPSRFGSIQVLALTLLTRVIPPGEYHVEVKGLATGRPAELVDDYYFSVADR